MSRLDKLTFSRSKGKGLNDPNEHEKDLNQTDAVEHWLPLTMLCENRRPKPLRRSR